MNPEQDPRISKDFERGLNDIAGYLLWQAEVEEARDAAETFADRLTWLTTAQREAVVRVYTDDRLDTAREVLLRIASRTLELRDEYQARYRALQARLLSASLIVTTVVVAAVWLTAAVNLP